MRTRLLKRAEDWRVSAEGAARSTQDLFLVELKNDFQLFYHSSLSGSLPVPKKRTKKRKAFANLSVNGRRRGLMDIRNLFKAKEADYNVPVSKMAGFIIQQVYCVHSNLCISISTFHSEHSVLCISS